MCIPATTLGISYHWMSFGLRNMAALTGDSSMSSMSSSFEIIVQRRDKKINHRNQKRIPTPASARMIISIASGTV